MRGEQILVKHLGKPLDSKSSLCNQLSKLVGSPSLKLLEQSQVSHQLEMLSPSFHTMNRGRTGWLTSPPSILWEVFNVFIL